MQLSQPEDIKIPEDLHLAIEKGRDKLAIIEADAIRFSKLKMSTEKDLAVILARKEYIEKLLENAEKILKEKNILIEESESKLRKLNGEYDILIKGIKDDNERNSNNKAIIESDLIQLTKQTEDLAKMKFLISKRESNLEIAELAYFEKIKKLKNAIS